MPFTIPSHPGKVFGGRPPAKVMCDWEKSLGFGERIRREREMRNITLDEIANATKIGSRTLRALEEEDFSKLPGGIFNKGFVRAYARYLGIDEEQAVADYMAAVGEPRPADAVDSDRLKKIEANWKPAKPEASSRDYSALPWKPLVLLLLLVAGIFTIWHFRHAGAAHIREWQARWRQHRQPVAANRPAAPLPTPAAIAPLSTSTVPTAVPAGTPVPSVSPEASPSPATAVSADAPAATPAATDDKSSPAVAEFFVLFHAREDSWVLITADGKQVMKGILIARREAKVRARQKITLLAGNAAGIEFSFNGQPQTLLGGNSKEVRAVTFTPEGLQP